MKDMPAFPQDNWGNQQIHVEGLTKREYIATAALQGLIGSNLPISHDSIDREGLSKKAVAYADALLTELSRKKSHEV